MESEINGMKSVNKKVSLQISKLEKIVEFERQCINILCTFFRKYIIKRGKDNNLIRIEDNLRK